MRRGLVLLLAIMLVFSLAACSDESDIEDPTVGFEEYSPPQYDPDSVGEYEEVDLSHLSPEVLAWRNAVLDSPLIVEVEHKGVPFEVHVHNGVKYMYDTKKGVLMTGSTTGDIRATVLKDWISPYGAANLVKEEALFNSCWENTGTRSRAFLGYLESARSIIRVDLDGNLLEVLGVIDGESVYTNVTVTQESKKVYLDEDVDTEVDEATDETVDVPDDSTTDTVSDEREYEEVSFMRVMATKNQVQEILFDEIPILPDTEIVVTDRHYELVTRARTAEYLEYIFTDVTGKHYRLAFTDDYLLFSELVFMYIFDMESY